MEKEKSKMSSGDERPKDQCTTHTCPKQHKADQSRRRRSKWFFPIMGIVSLVWFLIRVIPKPSRATYPCQRVAAPLAASMVLWLTGLAGTAFAYHKWKTLAVRHRRWAPALCAVLGAVACFVTIVNLPKPSVGAQQYPAIHDVLGVGKGIHPGRVVWVHNPGATDWAGFESSERWYDDSHTNPAIVTKMLSQAVRGLSGKSTDAEAWDAIFHNFNQAHNRGDRGYIPGEKIMIKVNLTTLYQYDPATYNKNTNVLNQVDASPQMMRAVIGHLVYVVGVNQSDISIGDPGRPFCNNLYNPVHAEFPNVNYIDRFGQFGRTLAVGMASAPFYWSTTAANGKLQDYLPVSYAQMDYFINLAVLKGHSSGITLCGKNNYGSLIRNPDTTDYYNMHLSLPNVGWSPGYGHYRAVVDLMGHAGLGGKSLLCLVDGLYGGYHWEGHPYKWRSQPFGDGVNGDWPSSLFASQDGVAIDSVCHDFLLAEWPTVVTGGTGAAGTLLGGAEDYLHEAALADNPPSGTFYDPERDGVHMTSLGTHEHWNDPTNKQYSRNRGLNTGIELVKLAYDNGAINRAKLQGDGWKVFIAAGVVTAAFPGYFYIEADDRSSGICVSGNHSLTVGVRANVDGAMRTFSPHGERYIQATAISQAGAGNVAPLAVNGKAVGGGNWNYDSTTGAGQRGVPGANGLNNIGLLIKTTGQFRYIDTGSFGITDGSGREIICYVPSSVSINSGWTYVAVTGISSCREIDGQLRSVIFVRSTDDIVSH